MNRLCKLGFHKWTDRICSIEDYTTQERIKFVEIWSIFFKGYSFCSYFRRCKRCGLEKECDAYGTFKERTIS